MHSCTKNPCVCVWGTSIVFGFVFFSLFLCLFLILYFLVMLFCIVFFPRKQNIAVLFQYHILYRFLLYLHHCCVSLCCCILFMPLVSAVRYFKIIVLFLFLVSFNARSSVDDRVSSCIMIFFLFLTFSLPERVSVCVCVWPPLPRHLMC